MTYPLSHGPQRAHHRIYPVDNGPKRDHNGPKRDHNGPKRDHNRPERDLNRPQRDHNRPKRDLNRLDRTPIGPPAGVRFSLKSGLIALPSTPAGREAGKIMICQQRLGLGKRSARAGAAETCPADGPQRALSADQA